MSPSRCDHEISLACNYSCLYSQKLVQVNISYKLLAVKLMITLQLLPSEFGAKFLHIVSDRVTKCYMLRGPISNVSQSWRSTQTLCIRQSMYPSNNSLTLFYIHTNEAGVQIVLVDVFRPIELLSSGLVVK